MTTTPINEDIYAEQASLEWLRALGWEAEPVQDVVTRNSVVWRQRDKTLVNGHRLICNRDVPDRCARREEDSACRKQPRTNFGKTLLG